MNPNQRTWIRYAVPIGVTAVILAASLPLNPVLGDRALLPPFLVGVVLSAWFGGLAPGLLATALSVLAFQTLLRPAADHHSAASIVPTAVFVFEGALISWLSRLQQSAATRAESSQSALRSSAAFQSTIADVALDCVIAMDAQGLIVEWNPPAERTFGYSRAEAIGRPLAELIIPPKLRQQHRQGLARYLATGESRILDRRLELIACRSGGGEFPIELAIARIPLPGPPRFAAHLRDITERQRSEQALRDSEDRFRATFEQAAVGIAHVAPDGRWLRVNQRLLDIVGYDRDELLGKTFQDVTHPDDLNTDLTYVQQVLAGEIQSYSMEKRYVRKDCSLAWVNLTVALVRGQDGQPRYFISVVEDIETRKQAEAVVARHAAIVESSDDAIVSKNLDGIILTWNSGAQRLFGYTAEEVIGRFISVLVPTERSDEEVAIMERLHRGERIEHCQTVRLAKDGRRVDVSLTISPVKDAAGRIIAVSSIARDITAEKKATLELQTAKEAAEAASKAKDQFLAILSHELRTPLTPALMVVSALEADLTLPPALREDLGLIRRNVELEARLIDDLLDLTRITNRKLQFQEQMVDMHQMLRTTVEICADGITAKQLHVSLDLQAARRLVKADGARLQQAFWNLMKNAVKFTPAGGRITIRSEDDSRGRIRVQVQDSGIGIEPGLLSRLFNPFEQGDRAQIGQFAGLGLGLAVARSVLEAQGGTITAHSEGKNQGAIFTVEMPTTEKAEQAVQPAREMMDAQSLSPLSNGTGRAARLLLVEDHPDTATTLAKILRTMGYVVTIAASVSEALVAAEAQRFDLLVSDIGLPDGSGLELMRQLKARFGLRGIAVSGYGMPEDVQKSKESGFEEHLIKPIDFQRLRDVLLRVA